MGVIISALIAFFPGNVHADCLNRSTEILINELNRYGKDSDLLPERWAEAQYDIVRLPNCYAYLREIRPNSFGVEGATMRTYLFNKNNSFIEWSNSENGLEGKCDPRKKKILGRGADYYSAKVQMLRKADRTLPQKKNNRLFTKKTIVLGCKVNYIETYDQDTKNSQIWTFDINGDLFRVNSDRYKD